MTNEELERHLKLIKLNRLENQRYRYYSPIGKVEQFINAVGSGNYLSVLLSAANGIGKTVAGVNILANLFWPCGNTYFSSSLFTQWPKGWPKKGRIISESNTIVETIIPTLREWFPKGRFGTDKYETTKDGKRFDAHWKTDTGWEFNIMTYDQDPREFESATLGFVWEDEPPPQVIHTANISRLRSGGVSFITETPLTGSAWLYDAFNANPNLAAEHKAFIQADVEDACITHGIRGFMEHNQIMKLISQYSAEERQARVFGKFQHLTGLVFKNWNRTIHVIKPFDINEKDYVVGEAIDPHPRTPDAVMWMAVDKNNTNYIIDELYDRYSSEELAYMVKKKAEFWRIVRRLIDPSAFIQDKHTGRSLASDLYAAGLYYDPGSKERQLAIRRTRDAFDYTVVQGRLTRPPEIYIFETCTRTIWEIEHWQWSNWQGKTAQYKDPKETPVDKDDHMIENLGRLLLDDIRYTPYEETGVIDNMVNIVHDPYS